MTHYVKPDKDTMCHRTGFTKSCHECVTQHGCRLWKHVVLEGDPSLPPGTTQSAVDRWDCADSLADLYQRDLLRRVLQTTATVDQLRKEVRENNDAGLVHGLVGLRQQMERLAPPAHTQIANGAAPPLLEDRRD